MGLKVALSAALVFSFGACSAEAPSSRSAASDPRPPTLVDATPPATPTPAATAEPTVSASAAPPPASAAPVAVEPAPAAVAGTIYAALFERNRTWSLRETYKRSFMNDDGKPEESTITSDASCTVTSVTEVKWALRADVTCESKVDVGVHLPLAGIWIATDKGLYGFDVTEAPTAASLIDEKLLMPRKPAASKKRFSTDREFYSVRTIAQKNGAWCWETTSFGGDEGWQSICFKGADGVAGGTYGWSGGSGHEVTFTVSR